MKIEEAVDTDDIEFVQCDCVAELEAASVGSEAIEPLLSVFERHPISDFGIPGDIMYFIEKFDDKIYFPLLLESFKRRPSIATAWAMNRILNVVKASEGRKAKLDLMKTALDRDDVEHEVKEQIREVLNYQLHK